MDPKTLYTLTKDGISPLELRTDIRNDLTPALCDLVANTAGSLRIGAWDQLDHHDRPARLELIPDGTLRCTVIDDLAGDELELTQRMTDIDSWLDSLQLRDLAGLYGDTATFYEALLDLSPNATISLSGSHFFVVITAHAQRLAILEATLPGVDVELYEIDLFDGGEAGPLVVRRRDNGAEPNVTVVGESPEPEAVDSVEPPAPPVPDLVEGEPSTVESDAESGAHDEAEVHEVAEAHDTAGNETVEEPDEAEHQDEALLGDDGADDDPAVDGHDDAVHEGAEGGDESVHDEQAADDPPAPTGDTVRLTPDLHTSEPESSNEVIDLRDEQTTTPEPVDHDLDPGATFTIDQLPGLFDQTGTALRSISDEIFTVDEEVVLVDKLPERRRRPSPFENPGRYRWDAEADLSDALQSELEAGPRTLHLFVESDRQPGYATYVGVLTSIDADQGGRTASALWFDIAPKVGPDLWRVFRKGRLPDSVTVDA